MPRPWRYSADSGSSRRAPNARSADAASSEPCTTSSAPRECDERRARADVVGMEVRDHDAAHLRLPELLERVAPGMLRLRRSEAAVDQRPALRILDRVAVDVVERPWQRVGDAVDAPAQIRDRQGARRPNSTKAACVTGMCSEKNTSTASANRRISSWAVSAFRRLRKFMSERALSVQWNCV